ncbi:protein REVEILLE 6-like isoform X3 [Oryza glaberrima]|uniref:protein REVEILLE 6-like isoform X3 n=1 Tax=Oryza glaberrima TaxID=4538 RepID=UPI00224BF350|nr:protein REVEILLE 6-like isoform X3 [Oryza glaberrima]
MVSMSTTPNPIDASVVSAAAAVAGGGGGGDGGGGGGGKEKEKQVVAAPLQPPMAVPAPAAAAAMGEEARKVRKPYTITKSRESWTEPEHDKFLEALQLFDRDWKKIEAYVGSKTVIQIRSHAQKYFLKVQKNGTGEHLPPPRPKRKAAHPYPQKASKNVSPAAISQPPPLGEQGCVMSMDTSPVIRNTNPSAVVPSWDNSIAQPLSASRTQGTGAVATNNCSSSIESPSTTWPTSEAVEQENMLRPLRAMPDFAQVYSFLGSIFDPDTSGHLQTLKAMDPIDVETVLLLMRNLSMNLTSPNFAAHLSLLSSCNSGGDQIKSEGMENLGSPQSCHLPFMVTSE